MYVMSEYFKQKIVAGEIGSSAMPHKVNPIDFGNTLIALASIQRGLGKLLVNKAAIDADLEKNWVVVAEALQSILRREGYPGAYEVLKDLTRTNEAMNQERIHRFVDGLNVTDAVKRELKQVTPFNYA